MIDGTDMVHMCKLPRTAPAPTTTTTTAVTTTSRTMNMTTTTTMMATTLTTTTHATSVVDMVTQLTNAPARHAVAAATYAIMHTNAAHLLRKTR